jgi:hypothetical protein
VRFQRAPASLQALQMQVCHVTWPNLGGLAKIWVITNWEGLIFGLFASIMMTETPAHQILALVRAPYWALRDLLRNGCAFSARNGIWFGVVCGESAELGRLRHPGRGERRTRWEKTQWIAVTDRSTAAGF